MTLAGLSLRDLEYVVAVADQGSFVAAARHCNVSQPSLSSQVRKVEAWANGEIFERTSRRVMLTPRGSRFVEQARRVLEEARLLTQMAGARDRPFGGTLRLFAISTLGPYFFPKALSALKKRLPDVTLVLREDLTEVLTGLLRVGDCDCLLMSLPVDDQAFEFEPIFREPFVLAAPAERPCQVAADEVWRTLPRQERLLLHEGHCLRHQVLAFCSDVGFRDRHSTSLETLKYMVAAGEGFTLMPALAAETTPGVRFLPLPGTDFARDIVLVWRRRDARSQELRGLAVILREIAALKLKPVRVLGSHSASDSIRIG
ncbi:MAG TPA: LysR substrate-binding domain-containing protein [Terracidiphilus sp.]|nr:LysR substrate-binding domain-containing protein [Terracidiphilus sp.]